MFAAPYYGYRKSLSLSEYISYTGIILCAIFFDISIFGKDIKISLQIQDEVLSHRLGLLPIKADPRLFKMPPTRVAGIDESNVDCIEEPAGDPERLMKIL